jgi:Photosynthetic reaction centre cytochrome C subunit
MKNCIRLGLIFACALSAETNFGGVWKADLEKSKLPGGPRPSNYLVIVEQSGPKIVERIGTWSERGGERRSMFTYDGVSGAKPSMNAERGMPMRTKVSWEGDTLVLDSVIAGNRGPVKRHETWMVAGNTLTINATSTINNQNMATVMVLEKQPDAAGEPLRKPEQTAGQRFKNVKVLKDIPASQFLDAMGSYTLAMGKTCEFCHVKGKDDLDDKKEKATARKMIEMTHNINAQNFEGKNEVRCYTCHKGLTHPAARPEFPE